MNVTTRLLLLLGLALFAATGVAETCCDMGDDVIRCVLEVTQDVSIERESTNYNYLDYLIIGKHTGYPLKRSLIQFEDLPATDGCETLVDATMYIYFKYAHKPSSYSVDAAPYVKHEAQLHMVLLPWDETEATSSYRLDGVAWNTQYLALDGTDANAAVVGSSTMHIGQPSRLMAFDVKTAVQEWFFDSDPVDNNGLLIKVEDEDLLGRDLRFYSNAYSDSDYHAQLHVICT